MFEGSIHWLKKKSVVIIAKAESTKNWAFLEFNKLCMWYAIN